MHTITGSNVSVTYNGKEIDVLPPQDSKYVIPVNLGKEAVASFSGFYDITPEDIQDFIDLGVIQIDPKM